MMDNDLQNSFTGSATYQITVEGKVDKEYIQKVSGLSVTHTQLKDHTLSTLTGEIIDQAALSGIINILVDYRYSVISVTKI